MLRIFLPIVVLGVSGCIDDGAQTERNGLSVEIDRSYEESVSQTYLKIKSNDDEIYCISSVEIDRIHFEMSDRDTSSLEQFDKGVNYVNGVDITEPIYFVDGSGMKIFVDNFDKSQSFDMYYFNCKDWLNKKLDENSIEKKLKIK